MRYQKSWNAEARGSASHTREDKALSLLGRLSDGPGKGRNVNLHFTERDVRSLLATLALWYPEEIKTTATVLREVDQLAEESGYNEMRYGREGYLRSQMLHNALTSMPSGMSTEAQPDKGDDGFSEDEAFKQ